MADMSELVKDMGLSTRAVNCLKYEDIHCVGDLIQRSRNNIADVRNLGPQSLAEIETALAERGLRLAGSNYQPPPPPPPTTADGLIAIANAIEKLAIIIEAQQGSVRTLAGPADQGMPR